MYMSYQFIRHRYLVTAIILIILSLFIWNTSILSTHFSSFSLKIKTATTLDTISGGREPTIKTNTQYQFFDEAPDYYETTEETITRLKRDVVVTGTILGSPGQESALFRIESMPDRIFQLNTQLMDGFIITEITDSYVVLKNQTGNETFFLYVQSRG